jgi:hypothetical protein
MSRAVNGKHRSPHPSLCIQAATPSRAELAGLGVFQFSGFSAIASTFWKKTAQRIYKVNGSTKQRIFDVISRQIQLHL